MREWVAVLSIPLCNMPQLVKRVRLTKGQMLAICAHARGQAPQTSLQGHCGLDGNGVWAVATAQQVGNMPRAAPRTEVEDPEPRQPG
jgi:hypothetical protein